MEFNADTIQQYGILLALAIAAASSLLTLGLPALINYFNERGKIANEREKAGITDETQDEKLDQETRQIANRLAMVAFDREAQLQRLQAEYQAQSELVRTQAREVERLGQDLANCRDVVVVEYQRQVNLLLHQIAESDQRANQLQNEIRMLKTITEFKDE